MVATSGVILSSVYMRWMVRRVFFGPVTDGNRRLLDLSPREKLVAVALVIPMFWIGLYPSTFLRPMDSSVMKLVSRMDAGALEASAAGPSEIRLAEIAAGPQEAGE